MNPDNKCGWEAVRILAKQCYQSGLHSEAENHFTSALKEAERFGESDVRLFTSLCDLGRYYSARAEYDNAAPLFERAIKLAKRAGQTATVRDAKREYEIVKSRMSDKAGSQATVDSTSISFWLRKVSKAIG